jgi:E3 ubiquitin-protein ligase TRIP12
MSLLRNCGLGELETRYFCASMVDLRIFRTEECDSRIELEGDRRGSEIGRGVVRRPKAENGVLFWNFGALTLLCSVWFFSNFFFWFVCLNRCVALFVSLDVLPWSFADERSSKKSLKSKSPSEKTKEHQVEAMDTDESKSSLRGSAAIPIAFGGKKGEQALKPSDEPVVPEEDEEGRMALFGGPEEDEDDEDDANEGLFGEDETPGETLSGVTASTRRLADLVMNADAPRNFNPIGGGGGRWKEYLTGLQSEDEMAQLDSLINLADELCVMTEETANGFKLDNFIPSLVMMLNASDNPNMVLLACRCMSHILEALPGSENAFVRHDAIPGLVEKLLNIEYDDLRDQAMNVLSRLCQNTLSASSVLKNGGLCAILANLDFSAINTQVTAVNCAANMLRHIPSDTWPQIRDALPTLSTLLQYEDPRLVEKATMSLASICTHYLSDASKLEAVVNSGALPNLVRLITERTETSSEVSNLTWMVIRSLATLCRGLPGTAETLISTGIPSILKSMLLMERENATKGIRQSAKTNTQAVYDMVALADQLLPPLPADVAAYLKSAPPQPVYTGRSRGLFGSSSHATEIDLMSSGSIPIPTDTSSPDARTLLYQKHPNTLLQVAECLLGTMTLVFGSRVNPQLRAKCISTIAKVIFTCTPEMLSTLLKDLTFSSFLASLLASKELKFVAVGISIAENLMTKLPQIFSAYFTREGVVHEVEQLIACGAQFKNVPSVAVSSSQTNRGVSTPSTPGNDSSFIVPITPTSAPSFMWEALASPPNPSMLKSSLGKTSSGLSGSRASPASQTPSSMMTTPISFGSSPPKTPLATTSLGGTAGSISAAPIEFGGSSSTPVAPHIPQGEDTSMSTTSGDVPPPPNSTELLRLEVVEKCSTFKKKYFALDGTTSEGLDQLSTLAADLTNCLWSEKDAAKLKITLESVASVFLAGISTHEFVHSALPTALFQFLTLSDAESHIPRHERVVMFIHTFGKRAKSPSSPSSSVSSSTPNKSSATSSSATSLNQPITSPWLQLVKELQNAIEKNENFQVKLNPAMTNGGIRANAIVEFLTKAFSVKLIRDPSETKLPVIPEGPVSVEPLATGRSIKEFIWNKLNMAIAQEAKRQVAEAKKTEEKEKAGVDTTPVASRTRSKVDTASLSPQSSMEVDEPSSNTNNITPKQRGKREKTSKTPSKSGDSPSTIEKKSKTPLSSSSSSSYSSYAKKGASSSSPSSTTTTTPKAVEKATSSVELTSGVGGSPVPISLTSSISSSSSAISLSSSQNALLAASSSSEASNSAQHIPLYGDIGDGEDDLDAIDEDGMDHGDQGVYVQEVDSSARPETPPVHRSNGPFGSSPSSLSSSNLVLVLNGVTLTETSSFFKALKEKATESALALQSSSESEIAAPLAPLWSQTHTIHYRLVDPTVQVLNESLKDQSSNSSTGKDGMGSLRNSSGGPKSSSLNLPSAVMRVDAASASLERVLNQLMKGEVGSTCGFDRTLVQLLSLLRVLETVNRDLTRLVPMALAEEIIPVPAQDFINAKLTAKLARQLQDPLALCTNTLPNWCATLCAELPFLFPLDLRQLYFRGSSLGVPRALLALKDRVEGVLDGNFGRITPHKVRVERDSIRHLNSAFVVLQRLRSDSRSILEVEYANEVATGAGPTLEFYTLVSHAFQQTCFNMWVPDGDAKIVRHTIATSTTSTNAPNPNAMQIDESSPSISTATSASTATTTTTTTTSDKASSKKSKSDENGKQKKEEVKEAETEMKIVNNNGGLFPIPVLSSSSNNDTNEVLKSFSFLGTFMAKAIMDDRMIDLPFSVAFFKGLLGIPLQLDDLQPIYPQLVKTLKQFQAILEEKKKIESDPSKDEKSKRNLVEKLKFEGGSIEDMWLTFDLPGTNVELVPDGCNKSVTIHNLEEWVTLVVDAIAGKGVERQFEALQAGFAHIFEVSRLSVFEPHELETLICGSVEQDWSKQAILDAANYTQGFSVSSRVSQWFATVLSEFTEEQRRKFLRFATGSPRLPPRGFKGFHHRLTLSRKEADKFHKADDYYPSVSTCFLFIKMPDYSSFEIFKERFLIAIENGQQGFGLS